MDGKWWLPATPQHSVPGSLSWDLDSLSLTTYGSLEPPPKAEDGVKRVGAPEWAVLPIIHGESRDGEYITAIDAGGANMGFPFKDGDQHHRPRLVLKGTLTPADSFLRMTCEFDFLSAWSAAPGITTEAEDGSLVVRRHEIDLASAETEAAVVRLTSRAPARWSDSFVEANERTIFSVEMKDDPVASGFLIDQYLRVLQDLLVFCLGRAAPLRTLRLQPAEDHDPRMGSVEATFPAIQVASGERPKDGQILGYAAPTVLTLDMQLLDPSDLLGRWFKVWEGNKEVLTLLHAPHFAPFMYSENSYGLAFQSAEALHRTAGFDQRDLNPGDHGERLALIQTAMEAADVPAEHRQYAMDVLKNRNDRSLRQKILDLAGRAGQVGDALLGADPQFPRNVARMRSRVSHGGARSGVKLEARYWYMQALRWLVRTLLLGELIDNSDQAASLVANRQSFKHMVEQLG